MDEHQKQAWEEMCFNDPGVNATQLLIEAGTDMEVALKAAIYGLYIERNWLRRLVVESDCQIPNPPTYSWPSVPYEE